MQPAGSNDNSDSLLPANQTDLLGKTAMVKFHLKYKTSFGQGVKLLGSHPRLGSWNLKDALELRWTAGDQWVATVPLPAGGVYEYKYVLIDYETKKALEWQMGSNAVLAVVVSETDVNVYDNWGNNPGAMVQVDEESMTRETKLQKWATEMMGYWKEARRLQIELVQKNNESQGLRNELAQLRMELSLERQNKLAAEAQITELQVENSGLKAQLVQKTVELNNTLAEVLQLLDKELEEDQDDGYYDEYENDGMDHEGGVDHEEDEQEVDDEPPPRFMSGSYGDMLRNIPLAARTATSRNGSR